MTHLCHCPAAWPLLAATALLTACATPVTAGGDAAARHLHCDWPDGSSLGVIHRQGLPLALTGNAVAGARECATRSTQAAQPSGQGWRLDWHDEVLGATYRAELHAVPDGGFAVTLSRPELAAAATPGRVACGPLSLPAQATLQLSDTACRESEDHSQALQDAWALFRQAVTTADAAAFRRVLAPEVHLAEGSQDDSPQVPAQAVASHLACVADLPGADKQRLADWARARPHILVAATGLNWLGADVVRLGNYGGMRWQGGRWQLDWLNASRSVVLRDCE